MSDPKKRFFYLSNASYDRYEVAFSPYEAVAKFMLALISCDHAGKMSNGTMTVIISEISEDEFWRSINHLRKNDEVTP